MAEVKTETKEPELPFNQLADAIKQAMTGAMAQANPKRENPNYVEDSIYNPRGVTKTPLTRRYFWAGVEVEPHLLVPEETALLEQLKPGGYHLNDRGVPRWTVTETGDGNSAIVKIHFPCNTLDERMNLPSMRVMLREMVKGEVAD